MDKKSRLINEIWSAITHGLGVIFSILALILLILKANSFISYTAFIVYGLTLFLLFLFSTLFHSLYFTKAKRVFQILDHSAINLLIVGTYTPYCLLAIKGKLGLFILGTIWILGIIGILYHLLSKNHRQWVETVLYVVMGWLCVLGFNPLTNSLGIVGTKLLVIGGILFSVGALVYSIKGLKYVHVIWHVLVLAASVCMFFSIYLYL